MKILALSIMFGALANQTFENKSDALDHLNNNNIWVAGMPNYTINENGEIGITLDLNGKALNYRFDVAKIEADVKTIGSFTTVAISCDDGFCIQGTEGRSAIETDQVSLIMKSAFVKDDGSDEYKDKYPEKAADIVAAFEYIQKIYK